MAAAEDVPTFAGIAPPTLRLYPIESHIAEKLHAYTMPRSRPNSRMKDLPDLALLATAQPIDAMRLRPEPGVLPDRFQRVLDLGLHGTQCTQRAVRVARSWAPVRGEWAPQLSAPSGAGRGSG